MTDYISREAALNIDFKISEPMFEPRMKTAERAVQAYADAISAIPAADVRPVVRGKWIQRKNWTKCVCSACSWEITFVTGNSYHYCPNCGADMREES